MEHTAQIIPFPTRPAVEAPAAPAVVNFEVGQTYTLNSHGDGDTLVLRYTVVRRTPKFVTVVDQFGETTRVGVSRWTWGGVDAESCQPWGRYSMSPVLSAENKAS